MSRKATSIEHELDQLKKRAPAPDFLSRKRSLYFKQVSDLASLLKPEVNRELGREASSDIATEWLELAKQALTSIAPELPQGLEQRREFKDAEEQVHKGLTEQFLKDALKTSEDEVDSHTRELAQCVLSNWISILEHAKQDNLGKTLSLSPNALPDSVDRNAI